MNGNWAKGGQDRAQQKQIRLDGFAGAGRVASFKGQKRKNKTNVHPAPIRFSW